MVIASGGQADSARFAAALLGLDHVGAARMLAAPATGNVEVAALERLVIPALTEIGDAWERGEVSLAQVYMSGRLCQGLVAVAAPGDPIRPNQPRMAIGVLSDAHVLGSQIVLQMLRSAGYVISDWGSRLSVADIVDRVRQERVEVLFLSVLMLRSALGVARLRDLLDQAGSRPTIVVGGAPFRFDPDLGAEVGADYAGASATDALRIMAQIEAQR